MMNFDPLAERTGAALGTNNLLVAPVADLEQNYATAVLAGAQAWASDGRKQGEGAGSGTGVLVYADNQAGVVTWRCLSDDTQVAD